MSFGRSSGSCRELTGRVRREGDRQSAASPVLFPATVGKRAYSHALVELADRICRLAPKSATERDIMLREQFVENVRDVLLRWELKRRIEADDSANFLALRKVAMLWSAA